MAAPKRNLREFFTGLLAVLLIACLTASFIGAWFNVDNATVFARAKELIQMAGSIVAIVIGYYFGTAQSASTVEDARSEVRVVRDHERELQARLASAEQSIYAAAHAENSMTGGGVPEARSASRETTFRILESYLDRYPPERAHH